MIPAIFDRALWRQRRNRMAKYDRDVGYLFDHATLALADRLRDVRRSFPVVAEIGCRSGRLLPDLLDRAGTTHIYQIDAAVDLVRTMPVHPRITRLVGDEEYLPLAPASVDLIIANMSLHWVNDLPGVLAQIRQALKPDGFFLGVMFGGETLRTLRDVMMRADLEILQGTSPHISPFATIRDLAGLLQRANFALPVTDFETVTVSYGDPLTVMNELRQMGEANCLYDRRRIATTRTTLMTACHLYQQLYGDSGGRIPAHFELLFMAGWAPS